MTTEERGFLLLQRLAVYPDMCATPAARERWIDPVLHGRVLDATDAEGYGRADDDGWFSGVDVDPPESARIAVEAARSGGLARSRVESPGPIDRRVAGARPGR